MTTVQSLAHDLYTAFERKSRDNGDSFYCLKDGSPEWMTDAIHAAHGDMMPDDWRYAMVREAASAIEDEDDTYDARDGIEADMYTGQLTAWLASRTDRFGYCDGALEEYGGEVNGTLELLQMGQLAEKLEVFDLLLGALEVLADDDDDA